jgi:hypothetical protein
MLAWQLGGVGPGQESITLIAYDEAGMAEAVGSFSEAVAGIEPLTTWELPVAATLSPATPSPAAEQGRVPELKTAWSVMLPDRVTGISPDLRAISHDQSLTTLGPDKKPSRSEPLAAAEYAKQLASMATKPDAAGIAAGQKQSGPGRLVKFVVKHGDLSAIAYWGGTLELHSPAGTVVARSRLPQDVTALTSTDKLLLVGLADGRVLALAR